jgi:XTP/dITP diphosphohydrolase
MKKKLVLASENENKVKEFKDLFKDTNYEIVSLKELGLPLDVEETGKTFEENAIIKASYIHNLTSLPVIADDSGLCIRALGGFPGVRSHRFMLESSYEEKCKAIIKKLEQYSDKGARFKCAIALVGVNDFPDVFTGEVKGQIINEMRGENGFGYDPIFLVKELDKTYAELTEDEKNKISHRAIAMRKLLDFLNKDAN